MKRFSAFFAIIGLDRKDMPIGWAIKKKNTTIFYCGIFVEK
jgi:hypothetical protein